MLDVLLSRQMLKGVFWLESNAYGSITRANAVTALHRTLFQKKKKKYSSSNVYAT